MKVSEITYESNIGSFIDYSSVKSEISSIESALSHLDEGFLQVLSNEMNKGGLDLYSANINGVPIFHNKASEIYSGVHEVYTDFQKQLDLIDENAKKHRIEELKKYIDCLENRIKELESEIKSLENTIKDLQTSKDNAWDIFIEKGGDCNINNSEYQSYCSYLRKIEENEKTLKNANKELNGGFWSAYNGGLKGKLIDAEAELALLA